MTDRGSHDKRMVRDTVKDVTNDKGSITATAAYYETYQKRLAALYIEVAAADQRAALPAGPDDEYGDGHRNGFADGTRRAYCVLAGLSDRAARDRLLSERATRLRRRPRPLGTD